MLNLLNWQQRMEESRGSKKKEWKRVEAQKKRMEESREANLQYIPRPW